MLRLSKSSKKLEKIHFGHNAQITYKRVHRQDPNNITMATNSANSNDRAFFNIYTFTPYELNYLDALKEEEQWLKRMRDMNRFNNCMKVCISWMPLYLTQATWTMATCVASNVTGALDSLLAMQVPIWTGPVEEVALSAGGIVACLCTGFIWMSAHHNYSLHRQCIKLGKIDDKYYPLIAQIGTIDNQLYLSLDKNKSELVRVDNPEKWIVSSGLTVQDSVFIKQPSKALSTFNDLCRRLQNWREHPRSMEEFLQGRHILLDTRHIFLKSPTGQMYRMRTFAPPIKQGAFKDASISQQKLAKSIFKAIKAKVASEDLAQPLLGTFAFHSHQFGGEKRALRDAKHDFLLYNLLPKFIRKPGPSKASKDAKK